jgi:hypothetical protein
MVVTQTLFVLYIALFQTSLLSDLCWTWFTRPKSVESCMLSFALMQASRRVPLYRFSTSTRQWQALTATANEASTSSEPSSAADPNKRLTCLTYNVFSGPLSKSIPHASHRTRHAIEVLSRSKVDVIALQEVSPAFEQALRRERWLRQDWCLTSLQDYFNAANPSSSANQSERDGCVIAIRRSMIDNDSGARMLPLAGQQGKVLITVRARNNVGIATLKVWRP